ncbi:C6 transcription factor [Macrophomina phaseolina]|uniref:C6 transcription factor n=1 Tax=Macrophomina phaseolina TaxID=35725 RepID=A0ABQ8FV33_9PEZI|nr:C6 transcription factor [Macrophomina phaseolina]
MAAQAPEQAPEMASSANKRRRIALACNACRVRKSRCDGQRPSCSSCLGLGFVCQYEPTEAAANVLVRKEYLSDLDQRVAANERMVQRLDDLLRGHLSDCARAVVCRHAQASCPRETLQDEESPHRANELEEPRDEDASTNGMAMTFIKERTAAFFGESSNMNFARLLIRATAAVRQSAPTVQTAVDKDCTLAETNMARLSQVQPSPSSDVSESSITALPSIEAMDSLLDVYFDTCGVVFPFIHERTMRKTYAECKANGFTRARRTWLGTLNMMFAMASKFDQHGDDVASAKSRLDRSNLFYKRAMGLCGELSRRAISLEIVHYLILVVLFCKGTQRSAQAWNIHGLLVRSAIALGLHSNRCREALDQCTAESRRRTWLVIYGLDKVLSMVFGRPAAISDEQMASQQPTTWLPRTSSDVLNNDVDLPGQFLAVSFRLYQVMSKSLVRQYGANMENEDLELDELASLQASGEFRKLLRSWTSNLPPHLRLCEPDSDMLSENTQINRLRVILSLRYHNVCILVHRPLFSTTIRHLFRVDVLPGQASPYLIQPVMAEAQESISSAESTIEIVHSVLTTDPTSKNNLGVGFFTLYYVFTAALVISGRLLWAKHGQTPTDDAAAHHSKSLLDKAETIFQKLNNYDPLVLSCSRYIRNLSDMYSRASRANPSDFSSTSAAEHSDNTLASAPSPLDTMQLDAEGFEAFGFLTSEIFDPSLFDGFGLNLGGPTPGDSA